MQLNICNIEELICHAPSILYIACLPSFHAFFPTCTWLRSSSRSPHLRPMNGLFTAMLDKFEQQCTTSRACMIPNTCQDFVISNLPSFVIHMFHHFWCMNYTNCNHPVSESEQHIN